MVRSRGDRTKPTGWRQRMVRLRRQSLLAQSPGQVAVPSLIVLDDPAGEAHGFHHPGFDVSEPPQRSEHVERQASGVPPWHPSPSVLAFFLGADCRLQDLALAVDLDLDRFLVSRREM